MIESLTRWGKGGYLPKTPNDNLVFDGWVCSCGNEGPLPIPDVCKSCGEPAKSQPA